MSFTAPICFGRADVRTAAEVHEVAVPEDRDLRLLGNVCEARELELLAHGPEEVGRSVAREHLALEARALGEDRVHLLLDPLDVLRREGFLDEEVVLELLAVVGAAGVDLGVRGRGASPRRPSRARPNGGSPRRPARRLSSRWRARRPRRAACADRRAAPSISPASAAFASPGPIASATSRTVTPAANSSCLPSGSVTWIGSRPIGGVAVTVRRSRGS